MSRHFVKATVRIKGTKVAAFVFGDHASYEMCLDDMRSADMARQLDYLMLHVAAMHNAFISVVSCDMDIVYADSAERAL